MFENAVEGDFFLRSFFHVFELTYELFGLHDTDDDHESRTDFVGFFELDFH